MQVQYYALHLACPRCGVEKTVNIPESLFSEKKYGHIKIQVPQGAVCDDHVFVVFLDVKGRIIGYETVDLSITSPSEETYEEEPVESDSGLLENFIRNLGFRCVAGLLHAKLFNYPLYLVINKDSNINLGEINRILDEIMPDKYKNKRVLKSVEYNSDIIPTVTYFYSLVMNQKKSAYVMNLRKHIIQIPWDTGLELEKGFIASAIKREEKTEQLRYLSFYFSKFLEDVEKTLIIIEPLKKISGKDLVKKLKEIAITSTITKNYVSCIKEFINRRISPQIAKKIHD
ncbi:MAG: hypothetical protein ACFE9Z_03805 [Promethearchaeota archaeon]